MLKKERKYEFRERMKRIHPCNIRMIDRVASEDEVQVENGWQILLPENFGEVVFVAARDFQEYLFISMNISVLVSDQSCVDRKCQITLVLDPTQKEDYVITPGEGVLIKGRSERGLAQALYCLEDKMNVSKAPVLKKKEIRHTFLFSPRMVHSGYGLDQYPNEHLSAIAHAGMDAILVFVEGINATITGFLDMNDLISRAARYGLDVYAYSAINSRVHPEEEGAQLHYDKLFGGLFESCPGLKGIIFVGESIEFPSRDPHVVDFFKSRSEDGIPCGRPSSGYYPCYDYPQLLECLKQAIRKKKPDADIVFWTYNWGHVSEEERLSLIRQLPTDISLQATYEMFESYPRDGFKQTCADYSLAFAGPGKYFTSEAKVAAQRGIRLYAMVNTGGLTWDIGTIPYEPMPYQWMERYKGLREAHEKYGLCGLMESHHFGLYPSFISDLAKQCFIEENVSASEGRTMESCLMDVIRGRFGENGTEQINSALKLFSEAIRCYTPSDADQYGAFRLGPAYPLCLIKEIKPPSEKFAFNGARIAYTMYPADYSSTNNLPCGRGMLPSLRVEGELRSLNRMLNYMQEGVAKLKNIPNPEDELLYLINLGEYICCCVQTGIHAKEWYVLTSKLKIAQKKEEVRDLLEKIKELIALERANAECALVFVEKDSRLGWEPSMDYVGDAEHIRWKLRHLDYVLDYEIKCYEKGSDENL